MNKVKIEDKFVQIGMVFLLAATIAVLITTIADKWTALKPLVSWLYKF